AHSRASRRQNVGLASASGGYDEQPHHTAELLGSFAREGFVNVVGGCCGTTPEHTRAIAAAVEGLQPPQRPEGGAHRGCSTRSPPRACSGAREPFEIGPDTGFVMIGERTNVTGSARFRRLIEAGDYQGAGDVALGQGRGGGNNPD